MAQNTNSGWLTSRYRHLLALTTALVYVTILLGVSTKATGSGLACNASWPLCDGGILNLFPASMPSFFEWFHRLVAGVTGLFILGTAVAAWRGATESRLVRWAATVGLILLPIQVLLGRATVLEFTSSILALHYWTAMGIFGSFVVATVAAWHDSFTLAHVRRALLLAVVLVPVQVLFGPQVVLSYSPPVQAAHYAVTLLLFAAVLLAAMVGWQALDETVRYALALALVLVPVLVLLGRNVLRDPASWLVLAHDGVALVLFATLVVAVVGFRRTVGLAATSA